MIDESDLTTLHAQFICFSRAIADRVAQQLEKEFSGKSAIAEDKDRGSVTITCPIQIERSQEKQQALFQKLEEFALDLQIEFVGWKHSGEFFKVH